MNVVYGEYNEGEVHDGTVNSSSTDLRAELEDLAEQPKGFDREAGSRLRQEAAEFRDAPAGQFMDRLGAAARSAGHEELGRRLTAYFPPVHLAITKNSGETIEHGPNRLTHEDYARRAIAHSVSQILENAETGHNDTAFSGDLQGEKREVNFEVANILLGVLEKDRGSIDSAAAVELNTPTGTIRTTVPSTIDGFDLILDREEPVPDEEGRVSYGRVAIAIAKHQEQTNPPEPTGETPIVEAQKEVSPDPEQQWRQERIRRFSQLIDTIGTAAHKGKEKIIGDARQLDELLVGNVIRAGAKDRLQPGGQEPDLQTAEDVERDLLSLRTRVQEASGARVEEYNAALNAELDEIDDLLSALQARVYEERDGAETGQSLESSMDLQIAEQLMTKLMKIDELMATFDSQDLAARRDVYETLHAIRNNRALDPESSTARAMSRAASFVLDRSDVEPTRTFVNWNRQKESILISLLQYNRIAAQKFEN